jgi:hypothetical protein
LDGLVAGMPILSHLHLRTQHRARLLNVSRILANLSRFATKPTSSQLGKTGRFALSFDAQAELTCSSDSFKLMEDLLNTSKDVDLDHALEEGSVYLAQKYRMIRMSKI